MAAASADGVVLQWLRSAHIAAPPTGAWHATRPPFPELIDVDETMSEIFEKTFHAGWASMDFNGHMGNTAYLDYSVDTRMAYFSSQGFPVGEFQRLQFGPVIKTDNVEYYREIRLMENFRVTFEISGLAENASRFRIVNTFYLESEKPAARVTTLGGWLSFTERKLIIPPDGIKNALHNLSKTDDFEVFKPSVE